MTRPKINSESDRELQKAQDNFDSFQKQTESFNPLGVSAPLQETEQQTKLSSRELNKNDAPYIKPVRSIARGGKPHFDEKDRPLRDRDWEYVKVVVENKEIIGEDVEVWTAKWGCDPAHFWKVPVNKAVYIPRHLAEQLSKCSYHRLRTEDRIVSSEGFMQQYGAIIADHTIQRIDVRPAGNSFVAMGF